MQIDRRVVYGDVEVIVNGASFDRILLKNAFSALVRDQGHIFCVVFAKR